MDSLRVLFGVFSRGAGYSQPRHEGEQLTTTTAASAHHRDPETLSASVNLEDIIDEYDEPSRRSRATIDTSQQQQLSNEKPSQSFFSFSDNTRDDETTSFYSALHDGFSLDNFEFSRNNKSGREFLWKNSSDDVEELSTMLRKSDFQISWANLTYKVETKATYADVWEDFRERITDSASSALILFNYFRSAKYSVNGNGDCKLADIESNSLNKITILNNVNGSFKSGELTAIMGPSGAGKTSLLNILSRRRENGFTGRLCVSGTNHRVKINAIPQDNHLLETLTVRENLTYASKLKNPHSNQDHSKIVIGYCKLLGLEECLDTRTANISGGQQKRLAIAQELLSKPDILILDEPTSGLDSMTCLKTLSVLKDLVKPTKRDMIDPIAILLTIHQPQREAFEMFDKVYVLANGGITIYDGPPSECIAFVERHSGLKLPSPDYNPATFLIEIASGEFGQEPIDALAAQVRLDSRKHQAELWPGKFTNHNNTPQALSLSLDPKQRAILAETKSLEPTAVSSQFKKDEANSIDLDRISRASSVKSLRRHEHHIQNQKQECFLDPQLVKSSSISSGKFFYKTFILTQRCWKTLWRNPKQMLARIAFHILLPFGMVLIMGTSPGSSNACPRIQSEYSIHKLMQTDEYISPDVQEQFMLALENIGVIFITMYSCVSANIAFMTLTFALDMRTCLKEYYNGWYSMTSYVFARIISNIPLELMLPTMTVALTYTVTEQNTGANDSMYFYRIIITALAFILGSSVGQLMGMMFGAIYASHITTALFASQGATLPFVLLSGFIARTKNMSKAVGLLTYTSLYKHCIDASFIARYGWNVCGCDPDKMKNATRNVTITGITDELRKFVKYWMNSQKEEEMADKTTTVTSIMLNSTMMPTTTSATPESDPDEDVFQMVAKQLSLYNTYGIEVKSCEQVVPYEMHDFGLTEDDLRISFLSLICLVLTMLFILIVVVQSVVTYRKSL